MKYINVVKFSVKESMIDEFNVVIKKPRSFDGMLNEYYVQSTQSDFIAIGVWESEQKLIAARPKMIEFLDSIRHMLKELSPELGVTDPAAGHVIYEA